MKDSLIEIKNSLHGNNSRMDETESQINDLEGKKPKTTNQNKKEKKESKNENSISSPWDNFKMSNISLIAVPEGEEKEQEIGNLFEKTVRENFPNQVKEIDMQVWEAQRVPNKTDVKRPTPRHIIVKMPKDKDDERILKSSKRKEVSYQQGSSHKTVS